MARILFCLLGSIGLAAFGLYSWNQSYSDPDMRIVLGVVLVMLALSLLVTIRVILFYFRRRVALAEIPVDVEIAVTATAQRQGPATIRAHVLVDDVVWVARLAGNAIDRSVGNQSGAGKAWVHPKTGIPFAFEMDGKMLSPIPEIVKYKTVLPAIKLSDMLRELTASN